MIILIPRISGGTVEANKKLIRIMDIFIWGFAVPATIATLVLCVYAGYTVYVHCSQPLP